MKVLLIILAVLLFINLLPLGAHIILNENGFALRILLGHIQIPLLPKKVKKKRKAPKDPAPREIAPKPEDLEKKEKDKKIKADKKQKALEKKLKKKQKPKDPKPLGATIEQFMPLVKLGLHAIADIRWLPTIRNLKLRIVYGGPDAGTAAMNYGKAWGIIGAGMAVLTRNMKIKKYDVQPELDYSCDKARIDCDATVFLTLGGILAYAVRYGVGALKILIKMKKNEKAVQKNESSSS